MSILDKKEVSEVRSPERVRMDHLLKRLMGTGKR